METDQDDDVADSLAYLAAAASRIATAITPNLSAGQDATGGYTHSLTEAVMGVTAGLVRIADSISDLAEAIREHR